MRRLGCKGSNVLLILASTAVLLLLIYKLQLCNILHKGFLTDGDKHVIKKHRNMPVLIIGGVHHSGTDLIRALLDVHSEVRYRCDDGIFVNSLLFKTFQQLINVEQQYLYEDETSKNGLEAAIAAFFLDLLALVEEPFQRLCTNSQFMMKLANRVSKVLPQAKFIFVVRDGRAVVQSITANEIMYYGYNTSNIREYLHTWNIDVSTMYHQCKHVGNKLCMLVHYEKLVLHPVSLMKQILSFLDVPWDESILDYEEIYKNIIALYYIGDLRDIDRVNKIVEKFPLDVWKEINTLAPMLETLGYISK